MIVPPREERFPRQHLGQYAPHRPHVDRLGVLLEREHDLGGAVPPRRDVFGHEPRLGARGLGGLDGPRQPEVAHLEIAVGVEEEVRGFEIAVDDVGRVEGFERAEGLVYKVLRVVVGEVLCADDAVHVGLHQFLNHCEHDGMINITDVAPRGTHDDAR